MANGEREWWGEQQDGCCLWDREVVVIILLLFHSMYVEILPKKYIVCTYGVRALEMGTPTDALHVRKDTNDGGLE